MAIRRAISVAARSVILLCLLSLLAADDGGFVPMKRRDFEILNMISGGGSEESTEEGMVDEGVRDDAMAASAAEVASLQTMYRHGSGDPSVGVPQPSEDGQDLPVDDCVPACVATCAPKCIKEENKPDLCSDECNTFCERDCQEKSDAAGRPVKVQDDDENEDEEDEEGNQEGEGGGSDEEDKEDNEDKEEGGEGDDEGSEKETSRVGESEKHDDDDDDDDDEGEEEEDGPRAADKPASPRGEDEEEDEARDGQGPGQGAVSQLGEDKGFGFGSTGDALFPWQQHSLDSREAGPDQCEEHCQFECVRECEVGYDKPHECKDECKQLCEDYCAPVTGKKLPRSDRQSGAGRERDEKLGRASAQRNEESRTMTAKTKKKIKTKKGAEVARPRRLFGNNPVYEWLLGSTAIVLVCGCIFFVVRNRLGKDTYVYSSVPNLPPSASV